jgi:alpha-D-ribose 1-methylphosphonate 5-triphosphate synthase subunit PhnI
MEDLYFYFDNDENTGEIENIIFKNCKFESLGGAIEFINCQFEGLNTFKSSTANQFTFTGCYGFLHGISEIAAATPYETMTKKFNPKMISKEYNFSEPITRANAENNSIFLDTDNSNALSFKNSDGDIYTINITGI